MDLSSGLFDWLVDGAPGAANSVEVVTRFGNDLARAIPALHRVVIFVTTLHPQVMGRWFRWEPGVDVVVGEFDANLRDSPAMANNPVGEVLRTGKELRERLGGGSSRYPLMEELAAEGFTDYVAIPMTFLSGAPQFVSFASKAPGGFQPEHLDAFRRTLRPLARIAEILAFRRTATNILDTYVGRHAGERVLAGKIQRGYFETLRAIIWFSDLRGFTEMSSRVEPGTIIAILNSVFDCQVGAIERRGGEILKFIGDGMLAVFPITADSEAPAVCAAALDAADEAFTAIAALDGGHRIGLALHIGEVAYGNIGGKSRLDFTVIGSAVNLAARLEGLTSKVGRPVVISDELSRHVQRPIEIVGEFELKGVSAPQRVFATPARTTVRPPGGG